MSIECAAWLMNATIARIEAMPSTTASRIETLGTIPSPSDSSELRTARSTTRQ